MKALKEKNIWVVPTQSLAERWFAPAFTPEMFKADPDARYIKPETANQWMDVKKNLMNNPQYNVARVEQLITLRRKLIYACQQNGVGLLLGCDAPQIFNVPGFSTHHELQYLVNAGLTPYQALRTGTVNVAAYLNRSDIGVIKPGAIADVILVAGNPLKDIRETQKIEGVALSGKWLTQASIAAALDKLNKTK
jgi:imidazolonepropionase-like amidohydrolase